jgi:flagellar basal-body rod modification protein FlgD
MIHPLASAGANPSGAANTAGAGTAISGLGGDAFLKLFVAQLRYQNPMEPADGTQLMMQTAQFTQVESLQQLAANQQQLVGLTQFALAVGLTGKTVTAAGADGFETTGTVESVRFSPTGPELKLGEEWLPMVSLLEVEPDS